MNPIYVLPFLASLLFSLSLTPLIRRLARGKNLVARYREDRWHERPTPLLGGVGIFFSLIIVWPTASFILGYHIHTGFLLPFVLGSTAIFLLGLADDILEIKPQYKLVGQIIVASLVVALGFEVNWLASRTANLLLSIFWIVAITNAFNLLDNMDGLSAGIAFLAGIFLFWAYISLHLGGSNAIPVLLLLSAFLGSVLGFLVYNFHPASIFMGDAGSLLIGFILAGLTTKAAGWGIGSQADSLISVLAIPVLILFIPIIDTTFVSLMRKLLGRPIFLGGKDHSSHRMVAIGFTERTAVLALYGFAVLSGLLAMTIARMPTGMSIVLVAVFLLFTFFFWLYLAHVKVYDEKSVINSSNILKFTPLLITITYKKRLFEVLLDLVLISLAYWLSYLLRFEGSAYADNFAVFLKSLPIVVACQLFSFYLLGVYRGIWQYVGMRDVIAYFKAVTLGAVLAVLTNLAVYRFLGFSRTVFVIYGLILLLLVTTSRFSYRLIGEAIPKNSPKGGQRALIYGAGAGGQLLSREIEQNKNLDLTLVGFIDDDIRKQDCQFLGHPVLGGKDRLDEIVDKYKISHLIVSFRKISRTDWDSLKKHCHALGIDLNRLNLSVE